MCLHVYVYGVNMCTYMYIDIDMDVHTYMYACISITVHLMCHEDGTSRTKKQHKKGAAESIRRLLDRRRFFLVNVCICVHQCMDGGILLSRIYHYQVILSVCPAHTTAGSTRSFFLVFCCVYMYINIHVYLYIYIYVNIYI